MHKSKKRLNLAKETLRPLTPLQLRRAAGGEVVQSVNKDTVLGVTCKCGNDASVECNGTSGHRTCGCPV